MSLTLRDTAVPDSPLARWDARWKLAAVVPAGISVALLLSPLPAAVAVAIAVGLALLARVPVAVLLSRIGVLAFGILPVLMIVPFTVENGWLVAMTIGLRTVALGTLAVVLVRTAPLSHTFTAANRLFVPGVLVQIAQLAYRYSLLFFAETRRLRIALRTRGFAPSTNALTYRTLGSSAGTLLVRGGDRAERVADAMRTRGFDGTFRTLTAFRTTAWDVLGFVGLVLGFVGLVVWDRW